MKLFRWGGILLSVLSLTLLIWQGFHIGFVAPLRQVLNWYEALMRVLFEWTEPYLRITLEYLNIQFGWHLQLYPHWKHVFVLLGLYFGAWVKAELHIVRYVYVGGEKFAVDYSENPRLKTIPHIVGDGIIGFIVAIIAGVAAGVVPLETGSGLPNTRLVAGIFVATVFVLGYLIWWRLRVAKLQRPISIIGGTLLISSPLVLLTEVPNPGLVLIALFVFAMAFESLWVGLQNLLRAAGSESRKYFTDSKIWRDYLWLYFTSDYQTRLAIIMLTAAGGVIMLVLANAGLKIAGL